MLARETNDEHWMRSPPRINCFRRLFPRQEKGKEIDLAARPEDSNDKLTLRFGRASQGNRWYEKIQAAQSKLARDTAADCLPVPEGVALVKHAPDVTHTALGRVAFLHYSPDT